MKSDGDFWKSAEALEWSRDVLTGMAPKLRDSAVAISVCPSHNDGDAKYWVELGASIMMDKPLLIFVVGDRELPAKLIKVADEIVRVDQVDEAAGDQMRAAVERLLQRRPKT